jgi:CTP:molybdopterin cytidylyltransferase MocA
VHSSALNEFLPLAKENGFACINNGMPEKGMHRSIRLGIQALSPRVDSLLIALADQPFLRPDHYWQLIKEFDRQREAGKDLLRPVVNGISGNPILLGLNYRNDILIQEDQDRGCEYLFQRFPQKATNFETQDRSFIMDIDTPEDYKLCVL